MKNGSKIRKAIVGLAAVAILSLGLTLPAAATGARVRVPNVVKDSDANAAVVVKADHLTPRFVGGGHGVYAQSIKAGTLVNEGTIVTLTTYEMVPNVVGLTFVQATNILNARQFKWTHVGGTGKAYSENLKPGSSEEIGTRVIFITYELVPNVVGDTLTVAEAALRRESLGYKYGGHGIVQSESPRAGTPVRRPTLVTLTLVVPQMIEPNWAGYAVIGKTNDFTSASVTFVVPRVFCIDQPTDSWVYLWAGLDGFGNSTVEQDGIGIYCATRASAPWYYAWYEMYPASPVMLSYDVAPGDAVTAFVERYGHQSYKGYFKNHSDGVSTPWGPVVAPGALGATAECIVEDPGGYTKTTEVPYISLGSVSMTGCTVNGKAIGGYSPDAITMENFAHRGAYPSALSNGDSFTVTTGTALSPALVQAKDIRRLITLP